MTTLLIMMDLTIHNTDDNTIGSLNMADSVFGLQPLILDDDSSLDDESISNHIHTLHENRWLQGDIPDETVSSESSFMSAQMDEFSLSMTESVVSMFENSNDLGPPPLGSLMDLWDTPFPTSCLHNFGSPINNAKCKSYTCNTTNMDTSTDSSLEGDALDDDSYADFNPILPSPVLSLTWITTSP